MIESQRGEFYQFFFELLGISQRRGVTLLNVDNKIASKAIATRIEKVLPLIIHSNQTGFIKGRYIGKNIRLIF